MGYIIDRAMKKQEIFNLNKQIKQVLLLVVLVFLIGCSHSKERAEIDKRFNEIPLFQIYIDRDGNLISPNHGDIIRNEKRYVKNILDNFYKYKRYYPDLKPMIYIHGGLNNYKDSMNRSNKILSNYLEDMLLEGKYPIFVSWDSGFVDNYSDHVFHLRQGTKKSNVLTYSSSTLVVLEDTLRGITKLPENTYYSLTRSRNAPNNVFSREKEMYNEILDYTKKNFNVYSSEAEEATKLEIIGDNWSILNPSKIIGGALADSIGKGSYNSMLRRTDLILEKDININKLVDEYRNNNLSILSTNETALSYFLRRYMEEERQLGNVRDGKVGDIILIGHSMGTIVANNIISKFQDLNFEKIIYMGAAASLKDIKYVVSPYLKQNKNCRYYNLSLDPRRELNENMGYDFIPRGSLLLYLDQMFLNVNYFLDRTSGIWWNIIIASNTIFPEDVRERVTLVKYGFYSDYTKAPQEHGEFDEFKFWKDDYLKSEELWNTNLHID